MPKGLNAQEAEALSQFHKFFHLEALMSTLQHNAAKF